MPPRTLRPGQRAELHVIDVTTGERELVYSSSTLLFEAPNWTPDGASLVINGDGLLFRVPASGGAEPKEIPLGGIPPINNDHVLSPDGRTVYVSGRRRAPVRGGDRDRAANAHLERPRARVPLLPARDLA